MQHIEESVMKDSFEQTHLLFKIHEIYNSTRMLTTQTQLTFHKLTFWHFPRKPKIFQSTTLQQPIPNDVDSDWMDGVSFDVIRVR